VNTYTHRFTKTITVESSDGTIEQFEASLDLDINAIFRRLGLNAAKYSKRNKATALYGTVRVTTSKITN